MSVLRAFALGCLGAGVAVYALVAAAVLALGSAGVTGRAVLGPVLLAAIERDGADQVTTLGPGLALVAIAGGVLNAGAAALLGRRDRGRGPFA